GVWGPACRHSTADLRWLPFGHLHMVNAFGILRASAIYWGLPGARLRRPMQVWPAIDIRGGKCVRLRQGDFARETVFGDDPVAMALQWSHQGARHLHLVDLDGARGGWPVHLGVAARIARDSGLECQWGGGLRNLYAIRAALDTGVTRIVIGTAALEDDDLIAAATRAYPSRILVGIDARDGRVATRGWSHTTDVLALDLARRVATFAIAGIVFTDIQTDGMLHGPNLESLVALRQAVTVPLMASGGITSEADVRHVAQTGCDAVIIGRALYEGSISLFTALAAADGSVASNSVSFDRE
ncbi:MAG TPA: 1-(5-phosphoribosyl)-5-[(5-phosphoribosylamino)methylideneamino]imidazole-4-carboxamide isomerase, partial [Pirellulaceae bacterium]